MSEENKFTIPEEYRERGWAKMVDSQEALFKMVDSQATQLGKPVLPHQNSTEEDNNIFVEKMKKFTATQDFSDITTDKELESALKDSGIPKFMAKAVIDLIDGRREKDYGEDEFAKLVDETFKGRDEDKKLAMAVLKELGEEDSKIVFEQKNNASVKFMEVLAKVGKKYGAKTENVMAKIVGGPNGSGGGVDDNKSKGICPEYYKELREKYHDNPHATEEDKRNIMRKYGIIQ